MFKFSILKIREEEGLARFVTLGFKLKGELMSTFI